MTATFRDARQCSISELESLLLVSRDDLVLAAPQVASCPRLIRDRQLVAVVPDFLEYARLLSVGQARAMLGRAGSWQNIMRAMFAAARAVAKQPGKALKTDFWLVAEALLRYDLALLRDFHGAVVLHPYLTDFAVALSQEWFLQLFFDLAKCWHARGIWTYQFPLAASALARLGIPCDVVVFASSQLDLDSQRVNREIKGLELFRRTMLLLDLAPARVTTEPPWERIVERFDSIDGVVLPWERREETLKKQVAER